MLAGVDSELISHPARSHVTCCVQDLDLVNGVLNKAYK